MPEESTNRQDSKPQSTSANRACRTGSPRSSRHGRRGDELAIGGDRHRAPAALRRTSPARISALASEEQGMRIDGRHRRTIWVGEDGGTVHIIDQTLLPHELRIVELRELEAAAVAIETHAGARRAADRRHRRLRHRPRAARRPERRGPRARLCPADPHAADGGQSALGARPHASPPCATSRASGGPSWPTPRRPRSARRTSRSAGRSASTGLAWCARRRPASGRASRSTS